MEACKKGIAESKQSIVPPTDCYHFPQYRVGYNARSLSSSSLDVMSHSTSHLTGSTQSQLSDNTNHTEHLRFPTPPLTPPHLSAKTLSPSYSPRSLFGGPARTHSVIMKTSTTNPFQSSLENIQNNMSTFDEHNGQTRNRDITNMKSENAYICEWVDCDKHHNNLESLVTHVTKIHAVASPVDGLYYCRWKNCARTHGFSARYKMIVHARTHTKEKPHRCYLCTKSFSRAENLKIHIRSHSGEKPYLCTYEGCHKAYSNSSDRFKHSRTHAIDKPYVCKVPGCQKRYTDPSSLRKHVKTFKHNIQLIDGVSSYLSNSSTGIPASINGSDDILIPVLSPQNSSTAENYGISEHTTQCKLCILPTRMSSPPHASQYFGNIEEDICHIKPTQMDYYFVNATTSQHNASGYLIAQHKHKSTATDLETPLDLRLNRN